MGFGGGNTLLGGRKYFSPEISQQNRVSSPSTHQNRLNHQKTKKKKLSPKWHSSYVPSCKIEVGKKQGKPRQRAGVFMSETESRRKPFIFLFIAINSLESNLCTLKLTSLCFQRL